MAICYTDIFCANFSEATLKFDMRYIKKSLPGAFPQG